MTIPPTLPTLPTLNLTKILIHPIENRYEPIQIFCK